MHGVLCCNPTTQAKGAWGEVKKAGENMEDNLESATHNTKKRWGW